MCSCNCKGTRYTEPGIQEFDAGGESGGGLDFAKNVVDLRLERPYSIFKLCKVPIGVVHFHPLPRGASLHRSIGLFQSAFSLTIQVCARTDVNICFYAADARFSWFVLNQLMKDFEVRLSKYVVLHQRAQSHTTSLSPSHGTGHLNPHNLNNTFIVNAYTKSGFS